MSFVFSTQMWRQLSHDDAEMIHDIASRIETSLNHHSNTTKPSNICAPFQVRDLYLGSEPPQLQILELSELTKQSFRAILSFSCANDAYLVLSTKVQANPMSIANTPGPSDNDKIIQNNSAAKNEDIHESSKKTQRTIFPAGMNRMLAANKSLIVPMHIRMIDIKIKALIRVSFHVWKGLIIKFLNDPLENVTISTTFDALPRLRSFLQQDIESKLREAILRDLPDAVYQWSREWINQSLSIKGNEIKDGSDQDVNEFAILRNSPPRTGFTMSLSANSPLSSPTISGSRSGLPCLLEDQKRIGLLHSRNERDISIHHSPTRHRLTSWLKQGRHFRRGSLRHNLFYFSDLDEDGIGSGLYFGRQHEEPRGLRQIISIMNEDENNAIQEVEDVDINEDIHNRIELNNNTDTRPIQPLFINTRSSDDRESPTSITSIPIFSFFVPRSENISSLKIEVYKCTANNGNHHNGSGFIHNKAPI